MSENLGRPHAHAGGAQNIYEAGIHAGFINLIIRFSFVLSALPRSPGSAKKIPPPCSIELNWPSDTSLLHAYSPRLYSDLWVACSRALDTSELGGDFTHNLALTSEQSIFPPLEVPFVLKILNHI